MSELNFKIYGSTYYGDYLLSAAEVHTAINDMMMDKQKEIDELTARAEKAERERDWLLERVGVDENGVFLPCGNAKLRMSQSINFIRTQLKGESND